MPQQNKRKFRFVQLHNIRLGLATNSSSSHSMVSGTIAIKNGYQVVNASDEIASELITTSPELKWAIIAYYAFAKFADPLMGLVMYYEEVRRKKHPENPLVQFWELVKNKNALIDEFKDELIKQGSEFFPERSEEDLLSIFLEIEDYIQMDSVENAIRQGLLNRSPELFAFDPDKTKEETIAQVSEMWLSWIENARPFIENPSIVMYWYDEEESEGPIMREFEYSSL